MTIATPYYLIDENKLLRNLKIIKRVRDTSGAKSLLALKCFSSWAVFPLMRQYLDGTTSSSLYEVWLGAEKFGKETNAYCVAYAPDEIKLVKKHADSIIFNSISQLKQFYNDVKGKSLGLRINPGISYSHFDLANPARKHSRLGVRDKNALREVLPLIRGCMFHFNCKNNNFENFNRNLEYISVRYSEVLTHCDWVSLGGGIFFTQKGYPVVRFTETLKNFSRRFKIQVFLEPGEAAITQSTELVTTVLDVVKNEREIAIVNASTEAHMLDLLIYRQSARIDASGTGRHVYTVAGRSCLAGDVFGTYRFNKKLKTGDTLCFSDAAGYTMVKKNWFNGLTMPSIVVRRLDGRIKLARSFDYNDFLYSLS
jgi:carboxynorspermidine decarboxylase